MATAPDTAEQATADTPPLLLEEYVCAALLALMVALMFTQSMLRNAPVLARTEFAAWMAHATEVLPSGLTWLTFLGCGAVTRRRELLRVNILGPLLKPPARRRVECLIWALWGTCFAALFALGCWATFEQRRQMTSLEWLPQWAVSLSVPVGSAFVLWRTVQNLRDLTRTPGHAGSLGVGQTS